MSEPGAGHWVMLRPLAEVVAQADAALTEIRQANGGTDPPTLDAAFDVAPEAAARLVEAFAHLGADISPAIAARAGLRPLGEVLL